MNVIFLYSFELGIYNLFLIIVLYTFLLTFGPIKCKKRPKETNYESHILKKFLKNIFKVI